MKPILFLIFTTISILVFSQEKINTLQIENYAGNTFPSYVSITFENTNSQFHPKNTNDVLVIFSKTLLKKEKEEKIIFISKSDYKEIEDLILNLKFSDFIQNNRTIQMDGYNTKIQINDLSNINSSILTLETTDIQNNSFKPIIDLILKKLNLRNEEFYR